jgi:hypothetical protein
MKQLSVQLVTLSFPTAKDLLDYFRLVQGKGIVIADNLSALTGPFKEKDIELAINGFHATLNDDRRN